MEGMALSSRDIVLGPREAYLASFPHGNPRKKIGFRSTNDNLAGAKWQPDAIAKTIVPPGPGFGGLIPPDFTYKSMPFLTPNKTTPKFRSNLAGFDKAAVSAQSQIWNALGPPGGWRWHGTGAGPKEPSRAYEDFMLMRQKTAHGQANAEREGEEMRRRGHRRAPSLGGDTQRHRASPQLLDELMHRRQLNRHRLYVDRQAAFDRQAALTSAARHQASMRLHPPARLLSTDRPHSASIPRPFFTDWSPIRSNRSRMSFTGFPSGVYADLGGRTSPLPKVSTNKYGSRKPTQAARRKTAALEAENAYRARKDLEKSRRRNLFS